ncbi:TonB-dependent receptor domain-containing protein, partial [Bacteroidota bacterium]
MKTVFNYGIIISITCILSLLRLNAQEAVLKQKYSFNFQNISIENALLEISEKSKLDLVYSKELADFNKIISINIQNQTLNEILTRVLEDIDIGFVIKGNRLILFKDKSRKITISGFIEDHATGERLMHANVYIKSSTVGIISNDYGYYSLTIPHGKYTISYSYIGYETHEYELNLSNDTVINISLKPNIEIEEVIVTNDRVAEEITSIQMSKINIKTPMIKSMPVLLGEGDVLKSIQLLPGVKSSMEGASNFHVRGGNYDQNLILLDGVPVYNINHLFGFMSVFNEDAIHDISLLKGAFPAKYGGRLSSVVDIKMKEGNTKEFKAYGSIGTLSSRLTMEGPIRRKSNKDIPANTSFFISGRRTYFDLITRPILNQLNKNRIDHKTQMYYYFYDVNAKINHVFSRKSRLYFSTYFGEDEFQADNVRTDFTEKGYFKWGNNTSTLRWNYIINEKLFSNTTLIFSKYNLGFQALYAENKSEIINSDVHFDIGIIDVGEKIDFSYYPNALHNLNFGIHNTLHFFNPGVLNEKYLFENEYFTEQIDTTQSREKSQTNELSFYADDSYNITDKLRLNTGIHIDVVTSQNSTFTSLQPRAAVRYLITNNLSVKAAYSKMGQYIFLIQLPGTIGLPTDFWVPLSEKTKPQKSHQFSLGATYSLKSTMNISCEGFYKTLENVLTFKGGTKYFNTVEWDDNLKVGIGRSYGMEFLADKKMGKTTGWISYTLSWSERKFEEIANNQWYFYKDDRRHDISISTSHKFNDRLQLGLVWVYSSGNVITLPQKKYISVFSQDEYIRYLDTKNNYRLSTYHRLDFTFSMKKDKKWGKRTWQLGLYNAY